MSKYPYLVMITIIYLDDSLIILLYNNQTWRYIMEFVELRTIHTLSTQADTSWHTLLIITTIWHWSTYFYIVLLCSTLFYYILLYTTICDFFLFLSTCIYLFILYSTISYYISTYCDFILRLTTRCSIEWHTILLFYIVSLLFYMYRYNPTHNDIYLPITTYCDFILHGSHWFDTLSTHCRIMSISLL